MPVTRTERPIQGDLFGHYEFGGEWQRIQVLTAILERGVSKNLVLLPNGNKTVVNNERIRWEN
jgi:hypothetical protein